MGYQCNFIFITEPKFAKIKFNIVVTWKVFLAWILDFQKSRNALEFMDVSRTNGILNFCIENQFCQQELSRKDNR